jgi:predicted metalloprotease with PDZ domain
VKELLSEWEKALSMLPSGKENPVLGLYMSNTKKIQGVKVIAVTKGLPAEKAGLMKLDVITKIDDKRINRIEDVSAALSNKLPGDQANVTFLRNGAEKVVKLILMSADDWPKPKPIKILAGGNVYPNVVYDGFLVFNTEAMFNNYLKGSITTVPTFRI